MNQKIEIKLLGNKTANQNVIDKFIKLFNSKLLSDSLKITKFFNICNYSYHIKIQAILIYAKIFININYKLTAFS